MSGTRIIGIGSALGDDRIGWDAVDALRDVPLPADTELHRVAAPAAELLPLLAGARRVILVDAVANGDAPGRVVRCDPRALVRRDGEVSGHGISVDMVLDLAAALGDLPAALTLIGVSIDPAGARPNGRMTPSVRKALPALICEVMREVMREACAEALPS
jgi:hydrogenase maturation protease